MKWSVLTLTNSSGKKILTTVIPRKGSLPDKNRSQGHSPGFCRKRKVNHAVSDRKRPEVKKLHSASPVVWRLSSWKEERRLLDEKGEAARDLLRGPRLSPCFLKTELCSELGSVTLCCQECLMQE